MAFTLEMSLVAAWLKKDCQYAAFRSHIKTVPSKSTD